MDVCTYMRAYSAYTYPVPVGHLVVVRSTTTKQNTMLIDTRHTSDSHQVAEDTTTHTVITLLPLHKLLVNK